METQQETGNTEGRMQHRRKRRGIPTRFAIPWIACLILCILNGLDFMTQGLPGFIVNFLLRVSWIVIGLQFILILRNNQNREKEKTIGLVILAAIAFVLLFNPVRDLFRLSDPADAKLISCHVDRHETTDSISYTLTGKDQEGNELEFDIGMSVYHEYYDRGVFSTEIVYLPYTMHILEIID